jgi:hypothetical protein
VIGVDHSRSLVPPERFQWARVMVPVNEPEETPVASFNSRTPVKLPVAPSNRPVPPVIVDMSSIERIPGSAVGVAWPLPVVRRLSPLAATYVACPSPVLVVRSISALKGHRASSQVCRRFHVMLRASRSSPRYARRPTVSWADDVRSDYDWWSAHHLLAARMAPCLQ